MDKLYIVMPAYNEQENIAPVVREWYPLLKGMDESSKLIVADGGSTDATHSILSELCKELPQLEILSDTKRQHGPKLLALYSKSIREGADYIFQTDSDGQTSSDDFMRFWECRKEREAVIGNRTSRMDGTVRKIVERVVCMLLWGIFRVKLPDANAPFRLMKSEIVEKYIDKLPMDYELPNIMLTTFFVYYHENIAFEEISFGKRKSGVNSINLYKIVKIGWQALKDFRWFKYEMVREGR